MENEIWVDVENYEGIYQVSNKGRIRSLDRINAIGNYLKGKIRKQSIINVILKTGIYKQLVINMSKNAKNKNYQVARIVYFSFNKNLLDKYYEVGFKDNNTLNIDLENLEPIIINGKKRKKITDDKIRKSRYRPITNIDTGDMFKSIKEAGEKLNISSTTLVKGIKRNNKVNGCKWKYVEK